MVQHLPACNREHLVDLKHSVVSGAVQYGWSHRKASHQTWGSKQSSCVRLMLHRSVRTEPSGWWAIVPQKNTSEISTFTSCKAICGDALSPLCWITPRQRDHGPLTHDEATLLSALSQQPQKLSGLDSLPLRSLLWLLLSYYEQSRMSLMSPGPFRLLLAFIQTQYSPSYLKVSQWLTLHLDSIRD